MKGRMNGAFIWFELKFSALAFLIFSAMYEKSHTSFGNETLSIYQNSLSSIVRRRKHKQKKLLKHVIQSIQCLCLCPLSLTDIENGLSGTCI